MEQHEEEQQAADAHRTVQVVVTGFGSFQNVPTNPTSRVVRWLQQEYGGGGTGTDASSSSSSSSSNGSGAAAAPPPRSLRRGRIHSCTILKVSARAVNAYLVQQLEELKRRSVAACAGRGGGRRGSDEPTVVLLLHFGADVHRPWFNLETRAINNATFRSPDEDGWHPTACPITTVPGMPLDCALSTDLDLPRLHRHLRGRGHDVQLSADAGKFVCNWTYYNSLALCREAMAVAAMAAAAAAQAVAGGRLVVAAPARVGPSSSSSCSAGSGCGGSGPGSGCGSGYTSDAASDGRGGGATSPRHRPLPAPAAAPAEAAGQRQRGPSSRRGRSGLAVHSLFVHVPAFESISEAKQQRFAVDLIEALCDQLHAAHWGGGGSGGGGGGEGAAQRHRHQGGHGHGGGRSSGQGRGHARPPQGQPPQHNPPGTQQQQHQQQQQQHQQHPAAPRRARLSDEQPPLRPAPPLLGAPPQQAVPS